jgi:hypothetical protein
MVQTTIDEEKFVAWLRGDVAAPQPAPPTKTFSITVPSRDVVVIPPAIWSAPLDRK